MKEVDFTHEISMRSDGMRWWNRSRHDDIISQLKPADRIRKEIKISADKEQISESPLNFSQYDDKDLRLIDIHGWSTLKIE